MKQFGGTKSLEEVKAACAALGFPFGDELYNKFGGHYDHVKIKFTFKYTDESVPDQIFSGELLWSVINGRFFGKLDDGTEFTSDDFNLDDQQWFSDLLDLFYKAPVQS